MSRTYEEAAEKIENALRPKAAKLGMRIKVAYDKETFGYSVDAALIPQRVHHEITESVVDSHPRVLGELLLDVLESIQMRLHDAVREMMDERDVRGRIVCLSDEDKETLHEMYETACRNIAQYKPGFAVLMQRLFK